MKNSRELLERLMEDSELLERLMHGYRASVRRVVTASASDELLMPLSHRPFHAMSDLGSWQDPQEVSSASRPN